ncbi:MAG: AtpZ/AtpI family protein [Acidimicrobiales bacterium]
MEDAVPPGPPSDQSDPSDREEGEEGDDSGRLLSPGALAFLMLGLTVALCLVGGAAIGYLIDALAHTAPLFTLIGLAFGVVIAVASTVSTIRRYL